VSKYAVELKLTRQGAEALIAKIEQLKADNAALIECVKEVARQSNNHDTTTLKMLARECLSKLLRKDSEKTP
jgi:hypothetical protein